MSLEELILGDYGTVAQSIGRFLLRHNASTLAKIQAATRLTNEDLNLGMSLLIQRRVVKFFMFEKVCKYTIVKDILRRRLYFPVYLNYVAQTFSSKHTKYFTNVMVNGVHKDTTDAEANTTVYDDLIDAGVLRIESFFQKKDGTNPSKHHRSANRFLVVNFDHLDHKIFELEIVKYVKKRYNDAAACILTALLKCNAANRNSIIKNLDSTKILISDKGAIVNEKENITEYLKYLCATGIVVRGMDDKREYFLDMSKSTLKVYKMGLLIKDQGMRRIFNMILNKPDIEDKDITIRSLLGVNRVKVALLSLQKLGMISQRCIGDYSGGSRIEHSWSVDLDYASLSVLKRIEREMCKKLEKIENCWDLSHYNADNTDVWMSDLISLGTDHLIMSYGLN